MGGGVFAGRGERPDLTDPAGLAGHQRARGVVGQARVRRFLDDLAERLLVVGEEGRFVIEEGNPLAVNAWHRLADRADLEGPPHIRRGRGREIGQRTKARVGKRIVALGIAFERCGKCAVAAALAAGDLAARGLTEQMELVPTVGGHVGVVGNVGETGRAAGVDVAVEVSRDSRLTNGPLHIARGARSEGKASVHRRQRSHCGSHLGGEQGRARVGLRAGVDETAAHHCVGARGRVVEDHRLAGRPAVRVTHALAIGPQNRQDLIRGGCTYHRCPGDRDRQRRGESGGRRRHHDGEGVLVVGAGHRTGVLRIGPRWNGPSPGGLGGLACCWGGDRRPSRA